MLDHLPRWQHQRRREHLPTHSAAANSSHVPRGQVAAAGLVRICPPRIVKVNTVQGFKGVNPAPYAAQQCSQLVGNAGSSLHCTVGQGQRYCGVAANVLSVVRL